MTALDGADAQSVSTGDGAVEVPARATRRGAREDTTRTQTAAKAALFSMVADHPLDAHPACLPRAAAVHIFLQGNVGSG
jgi:hypothetical protein